MHWTRPTTHERLPGRFEELATLMPPHAIRSDAEHELAVEAIDRIMGINRLTKGQSLYLETLVQLVSAYEAQNHAIDTTGTSGIDSLQYLLDEYELSASDLARLLGVHASMGSKILKGERSLTVDHLKTLANHFNVSVELFI